jgi:hypothetical protein
MLALVLTCTWHAHLGFRTQEAGSPSTRRLGEELITNAVHNRSQCDSVRGWRLDRGRCPCQQGVFV